MPLCWDEKGAVGILGVVSSSMILHIWMWVKGVYPPKVLVLSSQRQRSPNQMPRGEQVTLMNEMDTRWRPGESAGPDRDIAAQL